MIELIETICVRCGRLTLVEESEASLCSRCRGPEKLRRILVVVDSRHMYWVYREILSTLPGVVLHEYRNSAYSTLELRTEHTSYELFYWTGDIDTERLRGRAYDLVISKVSNPTEELELVLQLSRIHGGST